MTACVIYTRFSPRRNAAESESCETQEAICREHAAAQGWEVKSAHRDEGASSKNLNPGLEEAIAALAKGDVLLVYRRDRLARRLLLAELIRRHVNAAGARIAAVEGDVPGEGESPEAVFVRQVLDAVAELERKMIGARTKAALRAQQRAGKRVGRYAPYGFKLKGTRIVPDKREGMAVDRILELLAEGRTSWQVARAMDLAMPDHCRGKRWSRKTIEKIAERAR